MKNKIITEHVVNGKRFRKVSIWSETTTAAKAATAVKRFFKKYAEYFSIGLKENILEMLENGVYVYHSIKDGGTVNFEVEFPDNKAIYVSVIELTELETAAEEQTAEEQEQEQTAAGTDAEQETAAEEQTAATVETETTATATDAVETGKEVKKVMKKQKTRYFLNTDGDIITVNYASKKEIVEILKECCNSIFIGRTCEKVNGYNCCKTTEVTISATATDTKQNFYFDDTFSEYETEAEAKRAINKMIRTANLNICMSDSCGYTVVGAIDVNEYGCIVDNTEIIDNIDNSIVELTEAEAEELIKAENDRIYNYYDNFKAAEEQTAAEQQPETTTAAASETGTEKRSSATAAGTEEQEQETTAETSETATTEEQETAAAITGQETAAAATEEQQPELSIKEQETTAEASAASEQEQETTATADIKVVCGIDILADKKISIDNFINSLDEKQVIVVYNEKHNIHYVGTAENAPVYFSWMLFNNAIFNYHEIIINGAQLDSSSSYKYYVFSDAAGTDAAAAIIAAIAEETETATAAETAVYIPVVAEEQTEAEEQETEAAGTAAVTEEQETTAAASDTAAEQQPELSTAAEEQQKQLKLKAIEKYHAFYDLYAKIENIAIVTIITIAVVFSAFAVVFWTDTEEQETAAAAASDTVTEEQQQPELSTEEKHKQYIDRCKKLIAEQEKAIAENEKLIAENEKLIEKLQHKTDAAAAAAEIVTNIMNDLENSLTAAGFNIDRISNNYMIINDFKRTEAAGTDAEETTAAAVQ